MLRRALDAAERGQQVQPGPPQQTLLLESETNSLATRAQEFAGYGSNSLSASLKREIDSVSDDDGLGTSFDDEDVSFQSSEQSDARGENWLTRCWKEVKACWVVVADVDNLWDSPNPNERRSSKGILVVMFWFTLLATSYAVERSTFKLLVDRAGPFRLFSVEVVTATHALLIGVTMAISALYNQGFEIMPLGVPLVDVCLMALLDTVHMLIAFITGSHVPPTETVILVQLVIPLAVMFTQFVHPKGFCHGVCSRADDQDITRQRDERDNDRSDRCGGFATEHIVGSIVISLAVILAMGPAFIALGDPIIFIEADAVPLRTAFNTLMFALSSIPAAASQLYKEHTFLQNKQPVDSNVLNLLLSIFQFCLSLLLSPLFYVLQGIGSGDEWTEMYPSSGISTNFFDGLRCFFGLLGDDEAQTLYAEEASCRFSMLITILHVLSIIVIGISVDKIVHAGATKILYRGISAGIILSVLAMYLYDLHDPDFNYGPVIDSLHFACTLMLILGSEVYHRVSLQDATFETVYPEADNLYDDV